MSQDTASLYYES